MCHSSAHTGLRDTKDKAAGDQLKGASVHTHVRVRVHVTEMTLFPLAQRFRPVTANKRQVILYERLWSGRSLQHYCHHENHQSCFPALLSDTCFQGTLRGKCPSSVSATRINVASVKQNILHNHIQITVTHVRRNLQLCACNQPLPSSFKLHADTDVGTGLFRNAEKAEHEAFSCQFSGWSTFPLPPTAVGTHWKKQTAG